MEFDKIWVAYVKSSTNGVNMSNGKNLEYQTLWHKARQPIDIPMNKLQELIGQPIEPR